MTNKGSNFTASAGTLLSHSYIIILTGSGSTTVLSVRLMKAAIFQLGREYSHIIYWYFQCSNYIAYSEASKSNCHAGEA